VIRITNLRGFIDHGRRTYLAHSSGKKLKIFLNLNIYLKGIENYVKNGYALL